MLNIISQLTEKLNTYVATNLNFSNTFTGWERQHHDFTKQMGIQLFIDILTHADEAFFHSQTRKRDYLSKDLVQRTLTTLFGVITFKRRKYIHRNTNQTYYFIDDMLDIQKYQRVTDETQAEILHDISVLKLSYEAACDKWGLSKTFAYHLIKRLTPNHYIQTLPSPISCDFLHVVADEDHVAIQDKNVKRKPNKRNSYMLRHITLYTDILKVSKGRNKLENRIVFSQFEDESILEFSERINSFIYNNYHIKHDIFVYGDGAGWIKTLADELGAPFILDQFHAMQALFKLCGGKSNKVMRDKLEEYLKADNKKAFFEMVHLINPDMSEFKLKQLNYLQNNWTFYQNNFKLPKALASCAEGINSHYFASRLSSRPKGFCISNIHKLGSLLSVAGSVSNMKQHLFDHFPQLIRKKATKSKLHNYDKYLNNFYYLPIITNGKNNSTYHALRSLTANR